jgi:hypothetical protein
MYAPTMLRIEGNCYREHSALTLSTHFTPQTQLHPDQDQHKGPGTRPVNLAHKTTAALAEALAARQNKTELTAATAICNSCSAACSLHAALTTAAAVGAAQVGASPDLLPVARTNGTAHARHDAAACWIVRNAVHNWYQRCACLSN